MDASVNGVLSDYMGCLVVIPNNPGSGSDNIVLVFFPEDEVSFPADGDVGLFGIAYHLGDSVAFGGGPTGFNQVPPTCQSAKAQADNFGEVFMAWNDGPK